MLGVKRYGQQPTSVPVGYETLIEMYPLDLEEFLWANGINEDIIALLKNCLTNEIPVPEALHIRLHNLLLQYTVVGGMPNVVQTFIDTQDMNMILQIQRDIVNSYKDDMIKYASTSDKSHIRDCFESIPKQLSKENKKFQFSVIKKGATSTKYT